MSNRSPGAAVEPNAAGRAMHGVLGFFIVPALMAWHGIRLAAHWVWKAPRFVQVILVLLVIGVSAGGAFTLYKRAGNRAQEEVNAEWKKFEVAARGADADELVAVLDGILKKDPSNRDAISRKAAIESGEADAADKPMMALLIRIHLKNNKQEAAAREAKKLLAVEPRDWIANCVLGQDAIARKDEAAIEAHLSVIGDPNTATPPDIGGLIYALELFRQAGKDPVYLRAFAYNKVLPNLKNPNLKTIHPAGRAQILACYIDTGLNIKDASVPGLVEYWGPAAQLAESALEDAREARNAHVLAQLGTLQPPLAGVVARFKKLDLISDAEAKRETKAVEDRARQVWAATRDVDPANPAGYVGEADALLREGKTDEAIKLIIAGREAGKAWSMPLLIAWVSWAKAAKQTEAILPQLIAVANKYPENVTLWQLVAAAAEASNRRDKAIDAIQKARVSAAGNSWLIWTEARLWLDADRVDKALELLKQIPEKERLKSPAVIRAYARALAAGGEESQLPALIRQSMNEGERLNDPSLALAPALGILDAPATRERVLQADEIADRVQVRWSEYVEAVRARAKARVLVAEEDNPRWSAVRVRGAVDALNRLKAKAPADYWAPAMLAWVRYKEYAAQEEKSESGLEQAWGELTPILHMEKDPILPTDVLEAIGTLYYAKGQYDDAIRVLTRAADGDRQPASALVTLALAHKANGHGRTAFETLQRARSHKMTERVREDYQSAAKIITKE